MPTDPTITAFRHSPDEGRGLARDMRVRWAFEEVGKPIRGCRRSDAVRRQAHDVGQFQARFRGGGVSLHFRPTSLDPRHEGRQFPKVRPKGAIFALDSKRKRATGRKAWPAKTSHEWSKT